MIIFMKKIEEIVKFFNNNKDAKIVFDYPIIIKNKNLQH